MAEGRGYKLLLQRMINVGATSRSRNKKLQEPRLQASRSCGEEDACRGDLPVAIYQASLWSSWALISSLFSNWSNSLRSWALSADISFFSQSRARGTIFL
jgi:hypothetical protein